MTTPTSEELIRWRDAGVLVQYRLPTSWSVPRTMDNALELADKNAEIRPYRAAGHVQPHDGSAERPVWVAEDALVVTHDAAHDVWDIGYQICDDWAGIDYFIVLPTIAAAASQERRS